MKLQLPKSLTNLDSFEELRRWIVIAFDQIQTFVDRKFRINEALDVSIVDASFSQASTETRIEHQLGRVPSGYWVVKNNANAVVYSANRNADEQFSYLQASAAANVTIVFF